MFSQMAAAIYNTARQQLIYVCQTISYILALGGVVVHVK